MAMSAAATSVVSRDSSASFGSNRLGAYSLRSATTWAPDAGASGQARAADRVPATASATPWVRDAGFGLPVTTAMCMASGSGPRELELVRECDTAARSARHGVSRYGGGMGGTCRGRERCRADGVVRAAGRGMLPAAALAQDRQHALAEPVCLLQVRVPGQDELGDAQCGVLLNPVRDLGVAADQCRSRASAQQADARPQVRRDLQVARRAAVQLAHPALPLGLTVRQPLLYLAYHRLVDALDQPAGLPPCLVRGVPGNDVQPDAVPQRAAGLPGQAVHPAQLGVHRC